MRKTKLKTIKLQTFPPAKTPADFERLRRKMLIQEHTNAILSVEASRLLMGDKWADNCVAYRVRCLEKLGVKL